MPPSASSAPHRQRTVIVPILLGRGVRPWEGLDGLERDCRVEATSSPTGCAHLTFTRTPADS
jgi:hypothetical protein